MNQGSPSDRAASPTGARAAVRPLRRMAARFSLVYEELGRVLDDVRTQNAALEARLVPEIERLRGEVRRIQRENAAVMRLIAGSPAGGEAPNEAPDGADRERGTSSDTPVLVVRPEAPRGTGHGLFAELERGSREEIRERVEGYVPFFASGPIVDLGCGRGEFLEAAVIAGLAGSGADVLRLGVIPTPAVAYLVGELGAEFGVMLSASHNPAPDNGIKFFGGVFCSQVVEHLPPELLPELMVEIARALRPNGAAVIETPNPASFATHVHSFWRDPTHIRPVPDVALGFAARSAGLVVETTVYSSLPPPEERLQSVGVIPSDPELRVLVDAFNAMAERLNDLLYGYQDYALVLRKPS